MFENSPDKRLILASASPRRKELLSSAGVKFDVIVPDCDESLVQGETVDGMVKRLSSLKAEKIASNSKSDWVLAADTTVYIDGKILGKPQDRKEAFVMLQNISGRWHEVWGGVCLLNLSDSVKIVRSYKTDVLMRKLSVSEINNFIETGEPMDKAGAYAIQGIGAALVSEIKGSYSNVVGLNLCAVLEMLIEHKIIR